ncbi:MAG: HAD family hydrolase, partial [Planctomycetota bacterium]
MYSGNNEEPVGQIPGIGCIPRQYVEDLQDCEGVGDLFKVGKDGVRRILTTRDEKVDFIIYDDHALAHVRSQMGQPGIYPLSEPDFEPPAKAVLMDLDGTSVKSEGFWIWIIERTTASLIGDESFELEPADEPHVSGHSVSEHLQYCVDKYCPDKSVEEARDRYFRITRRELKAIEEGHGRTEAFTPAPGLKEFLQEVKGQGLKVGLVTSGLYEKAWPEIVAAFREMEMGDPKEFYDSIVTAGYPLGRGEPGTLGELTPKPHPWLYAETARVGLGM